MTDSDPHTLQKIQAPSIFGLDTLLMRIASSGEIVYLNKMAAETFGIVRKEVVGCPLANLQAVLPSDLPEMIRHRVKPDITHDAILVFAGRTWAVRITKRSEFTDIVMHDKSREQQLENTIHRYLSPELIHPEHGDHSTYKFPEHRLMTVSFTDMCGFTTISETHSSEDTRLIVNEYLEAVISAVLKYGATIDQIAGDDVMAFYGAPHYYQDHALRAVLTVCEQMKNLSRVRKELANIGIRMPASGAGLSTGNMLVGNVGGPSRMHYTVVGASVNRASRLCGTAKEGQILLTESTLKDILSFLPDGWAYKTERIDDISIPDRFSGKIEAVYDLGEEAAGRRITIGPNIDEQPENVELQFSYLYKIKFKGIPEPLTIIEAEQIKESMSPVEIRQKRSGDHIADGDDDSGEKIFGKYRLLESIGRGGTGEVWKARDHFGNIVALKLLLSRPDGDGRSAQRLKREATALSRLQHRRICKIYEIGEYESIQYIAMEYVEGVALSDLLRNLNSYASHGGITAQGDQNSLTPKSGAGSKIKGGNHQNKILPVQQTLSLGLQICDAIQYSHERGVLHRDLKPANVMVRPSGEVVVTDFGLAKLLTEPEEQPYSYTGQLIGTLDYMSPEQAKSAKDVNEQTDVYGIGGLLYRMSTGENPFSRSDNLMDDIVRLQNHSPPEPHLLNPSLDSDFSTILQKALSPERHSRYRSVHQLSADLRRYRNGDPITAKRQTILYRISRKIKRHPAVSLLLGLLLMLSSIFGSVFTMQYFKQWGSWIQVYQMDFTSASAVNNDLEFWDGRLEKRVVPWRLKASSGMSARPYEWCWLTQPIHGDVKAVIRVRYKQSMPTLAFSFNSRIEALPSLWHVPPGICCQFGKYAGTLSSISKNQNVDNAEDHFAGICKLIKGKVHELVVERINNKVAIYIDGQKQIEYPDYIPLEGTGFNRMGFVFHDHVLDSSSQVEILSLSVYRLSLPEKASPIIAGDMLVRYGKYAEAAEQYLNIEKDYHNGTIAELAMMKAYLSAGRVGQPDDRKRQKHILKQYKQYYPDSEYLSVLLEEEAAHLWQEGKKEAALDAMPHLFQLNPHNKVIHRILQLAHGPITKNLRPKLANWIQQSKNLHHLDISACGFNDLKFVQNLNLKVLNCAHNEIDSLAPLQGMDLKILDCSDNRIASLVPLKGMNLNSLFCSNNKIESLKPLRGMRLENLHFSENQVADLTPLEGMPLRIMQAGRNRIRSLEPLKNSPLKGLAVDYNRIDNLDALTGLNLNWLNCNGNQISDLVPLKGMALSSLNCCENQIKSLAPLKKMNIKWLWFRDNDVTDLSPLMQMGLEILDCSNNRIGSLLSLQEMNLKWLDVSNNHLVSLFPIAHKPPDYFVYDSPFLDGNTLADAASFWKEKGYRQHAHFAELLIAFRKQEPAEIRKLAIRYQNSTFLLIPKALDWHQAESTAKEMGGKLASISSKTEDNWIGTAFMPSAMWLGGYRRLDGTWRWAGENKWKYENWSMYNRYKYDGPDARLLKALTGEWMSMPASRRYFFLVEWEDPN